MKVYIKTEATGDEELTGTVSFVSPTATKNSGTSGDATSSDASTSDGTSAVSTTRATYRVDVTLDEANSDLRLGMTAKMNFVLASADNVLVVPTADITTSGDESFVTVLKNGKETEVPVEVGIANDYYTVIKSDDIKEGDEVLMVTDLGSDEEDEDLLMGAY
jgi:multidrug efflux pump subunit AcrA (membrane-fusion protein)